MFYDTVNLMTFYDDRNSIEKIDFLKVTFATVYSDAVVLSQSVKSMKKDQLKVIQNQTNFKELYDLNMHEVYSYAHKCKSETCE